MSMKNTAWLTRARLKAAALTSEADAAGELVRRLSADANDIGVRINQLEQQRADLEQQRELANNLVDKEAKHARLHSLDETTTAVNTEIEILQAWRVELQRRQQAASAIADEKIRFKEGVLLVMAHIGGYVPGVAIGDAR